MALAEWNRAYVEDWTLWVYRIWVSSVYVWFSCSRAAWKRHICLVWVFTCLMIQFVYWKYRCYFLETNQAVTAQIDGLGDACQLWSFERWATEGGQSVEEGARGTQGCCMCPQLSAVCVYVCIKVKLKLKLIFAKKSVHNVYSFDFWFVCFFVHYCVVFQIMEWRMKYELLITVWSLTHNNILDPRKRDSYC